MERSHALVAELLKGNIPGFLRELKPVEVTGTEAAGGRATVWVMPDYLAVGSDTDFVRVPLGLEDAVAVARGFGLMLPTRKIVDSVYAQAEKKVEPRPMPAGPLMTSVDYLLAHNRTIEEQLRGLVRGAIVSGDKKDLVLTHRLVSHPGRVAIYGWHRLRRPAHPAALAPCTSRSTPTTATACAW